MKPFAVTFAARQFGAWTFILTSAVVGRAFGPATRGAVEGLAVLRLGLHAVACAGIPAAATWLVARRATPVADVAGAATAASLALGVVAALVLAAGAFLLPQVFAPLPPWAVAAFVATAPATLVGQALSGVLLGADRTNAWNGLVVAQRAVVLVALLVLLVPPLRRAETVVAGMALAEVASAVLGARFVGPAWRPRRGGGALREARGYLRAAFLHGVFAFAFVRCDVLVLSALAGTEASGQFAAASLARDMLMFVPWIAGMLHVPKVAAASGTGRRAARPMGPVSIAVTLAVAAAIFAFPTTFVTTIHGGRFVEAGVLARILVPTALVAGVGHLLLAELLGRGAPPATYLAPGLAFLGAVAGNVLFVPRHGAVATAWTALVASVVMASIAAAGVAAARRRDRPGGGAPAPAPASP